MAEPVDPAADFRTTTGAAGTVQVAFYDPALDLPDAATVHGDEQDATGVRDTKRDEYQATADGEVRVVRTTWYVDCSGLVGGRPPMKSLIVDGDDTWVIDNVGPDAEDAVYAFTCTLKG